MPQMGSVMPKRFIDSGMDADTVKAIVDAFDFARRELGLAATNDAVTDFLALKIVEFARKGERDPNRLRDLTLRALQDI
jgi:hypothetical protein